MKKPTFIIAEIGNNHEGNFVLAKKLVTLAAKAKVDAVKFQVFKPDTLAVQNSRKNRLQKKNFRK